MVLYANKTIKKHTPYTTPQWTVLTQKSGPVIAVKERAHNKTFVNAVWIVVRILMISNVVVTENVTSVSGMHSIALLDLWGQMEIIRFYVGSY